MIWFIVIFSSFFAILGFILTPKNARYLLAGYNTMNDRDRQKVDIVQYVKFFRQFHIGLAILCLLLGLMLYYTVDKDIAMISVSLLPIVAYIYFIWKSQQYYHGKTAETNNNLRWLVIAVLIFTLVLCAFLFYQGGRENVLTVSPTGVEISGMYGEQIKWHDIESIELVETLPTITNKLNGYSLSESFKGYFRTSDQEKVKLLLNNTNKPVILIQKKSGENIYYSADSQNNVELYQMLNQKNRN